MIKFKKKMNYLKGFILYALVCIFAFLPFMSFNTYAWSVDSNGNLVSDNLIDNSTSVFEMGAVSYNIGNTYSQNKVSSNARIRTINLINVDSTKTYSLSVPSPYLVIAQGYNNNLQVSANGTQFNQALPNLSFTGVSQVSIIVRKIDNSNFSSVSDISSIDLMFNIGNVKNYEPYGAVYYSDSTMEKMVQSSFGAFAYASEIRLYYNNGTVSQLYKTYSSCYDMALENFCRFINGSLRIDDYSFIFTLLGGNSDWSYSIGVDFPSTAVKVSTFKDWSFYGYSKFNFTSYSSTYVNLINYEAMNPYVIDLTSNSINNLNEYDYIKTIYYYRKTPNIGIPYGQFGTPNSGYYYNEGYNDGYEQGQDDGFNSGFDDGKQEGIDIGYNMGYNDGVNDDLATNGFKTLIGSIFNYPINFVSSVFNFEIFGINISSLIMFVLSIGIVIFVIKRFKG